MKNKGAELVSAAILGTECKTILIGGEAFFLKPPTIKKIAGAGAALADYAQEEGNFGDILKAMTDATKAAKALSWFIKGKEDEKLVDWLCEHGTLTEVVNGLAEAVKMLGIEDFQRLSDISLSVQRLIANPK